MFEAFAATGAFDTAPDRMDLYKLARPCMCSASFRLESAQATADSMKILQQDVQSYDRLMRRYQTQRARAQQHKKSRVGHPLSILSATKKVGRALIEPPQERLS